MKYTVFPNPRIILDGVTVGYEAHLQDCPEKWEAGRSINDAVEKLLRSNYSDVMVFSKRVSPETWALCGRTGQWVSEAGESVSEPVIFYEKPEGYFSYNMFITIELGY